MKEAAKTEAAFSCVTKVEQHPQREEEPHNRNSEPPAILLCHESPAELCLSYGNDRLSVSGELCGTARSKREGGGPIRFQRPVRTSLEPADQTRTSDSLRRGNRPSRRG